MAVQKPTESSKVVMLLMALVIAVAVSFFYDKGIFRKAELLTLDGRFLLGSSLQRSAVDHTTLSVGDWFKELLSPPKRAAAAAPDVVFIDMPEAGSDITTSLSLDTCLTAARMLFAGGAKAVVINSIILRPSYEWSDSTLGGVISATRSVFMPILFKLNRDKVDYLYAGEGVNGVTEPWPLFIDLGANFGHINAFPDADGKIRRVPATIRHKGKDLYHLGLAVAIEVLAGQEANVEFSPEAHTITVYLPDGRLLTVPLEKDNQFIINWGAIEKKALRHISLRDMLESHNMERFGMAPKIDPKAFEGKICVLGTTESNAFTGMPPKLEHEYSPASATALIAACVLQRGFVRTVPKAFDIGLIVLVCLLVGTSLVSRPVLSMMMIGVIAAVALGAIYIYGLSNIVYLIVVIVAAVPLGVLLSRFRLFSGMLFTAFSIAGCLIISAGLFKFSNLIITTFYPVLGIVLVFVFFYAYTRLMALLGNLRLFNLATKDGLTGLYNRRHFNLLIDSELDHAVLHKTRKMSLLMCDIDNFKKLNDTYGHQAGDKILREFAKVMKSKCRSADVVARYGGEEFIIIFMGAGLHEAFRVADGIRHAIAEKKFTFKNQSYSTSMSMGLVQFTKEKTKEELIEKADKALYRAKNTGKNKVCVFE